MQGMVFIVAALAFPALVCWLVLMGFYWLSFFRLARFKPVPPATDNLPPVSVVICARNEAQNLHKFLPLVFSQDYPRFQVVVVNDCSWDESEHILEEFQAKHSNLHVVHLKEDEIREHDKKLAITLGIKGAIYPNLIFTDADCYPASTQWLRHMASGYTAGAQVLVGYAPFSKTRGLLNTFVRMDAFLNAVQYLSAAVSKRTYMAVGRNMGYTRELFFASRGFASHYHIQSGDDDLFVNKIASGSNALAIIHPDAFVFTPAKKKFRQWVWQKKRHLSTSRHYKNSSRLRLGAYALADTLVFPLLLALFFLPMWPYQQAVVAGAWGLLFISRAIVLFGCSRTLQEKDLWVFSLFTSWVLLFIYPYLHFVNLFTKRHRWK